MKVKAQDVLTLGDTAKEIEECLRLVSDLDGKFSSLFSKVREKMHLDFSPADDEFESLHVVTKRIDDVRNHLGAVKDGLEQALVEAKGV